MQPIQFNDLDEFQFKNESDKPYYDYEIELGSSKTARYSCACHKCNIAVRLAIKNHTVLCNLLSTLSKYAAKNKNSINLIKLNIEYHARLRIENTTRWSSSYLMLMSFHKAIMKNTFTAENPSPIDLETLELIFKYYNQLINLVL